MRPAESRSCFATILTLLGAVAVPALFAAARNEAPPPILTSIKAIRVLSPDEAARGRRVRVRGTITHLKEPAPAGMIIHDGEAGQFVAYNRDSLQAYPRLDLLRGDLVEVEGITIQGGFAPDVLPERITRLGRSSFPQPQHLSYAALMTGRYDCEYVEITGIGQRTWMAEPPSTVLFLEVAVEGGTVRAWFWDYAADEEIYLALQAGAMGYLLKTVQPEELLLTIRKAASGERHISAEASARLAARSPRSHLSPRELAVLRLVVGGKRNKEIATALDITEGTVKIHVSNILVKLGVSDRTEAVTAALQRGIIPLPS